MNNKLNGKIDFWLIIKSVLLQIGVTVGFIAIFAAVMYFAEIDSKFSPIFGSVAVALGAFFNAFYLASKKKSKGYLYGLIVGGITFLLITVIGLIMGNSITVNTLFHLIIIMLSSIIGGILGVNKKGEKYI